MAGFSKVSWGFLLQITVSLTGRTGNYANWDSCCECGSPYCCVGSNRDTSFWANHGNSRSHIHLLSTNHHGQFSSFIFVKVKNREQMIFLTWGGKDINTLAISCTSQPWKRFQGRVEVESNFRLRFCLHYSQEGHIIRVFFFLSQSSGKCFWEWRLI